MYSDTFRFLLRNSSLYTFVTFYRWCEMRARFFNFFFFWYDFTCFLVRIFYKELTLLQCNITRHGLIQLDNQNCILVVIEREGKWMMMILLTRWTFEQVSWRSVWCCLKSKVTHYPLMKSIIEIDLFLCITCMISVVSKKGGQGFLVESRLWYN